MFALVTGGGGFLGRHIVQKCLVRGDRVRVLGRRAYPDLAEQGVECIQGDVSDRNAVHAACTDVDTVFHVASLAGVWGARSLYYNTNVTGTENVLAACRSHKIPRLVYTSTPSVVYGREPIDGGDETLAYPSSYLTHYAETKAQAERMVLGANDETLRTCALRPHLIWGPGDTNLIPRLMNRAQRGRLAQVGDGSNRISVSYVENVADAHLAACDRLQPGSPVCGAAYFINEETPVKCWDFIFGLLEGLGCPPVRKRVSLRAAYAIGAVMEAAYGLFRVRSEPPMTRFLALQLATSHWFHIDKAKRDLDWTPTVTVEDGMTRLFASVQGK